MVIYLLTKLKYTNSNPNILKKIKKTGLYRYVYDFLANYDSIDVADVLDIEKIFNKIIWYKIIFGFI